MCATKFLFVVLATFLTSVCGQASGYLNNNLYRDLISHVAKWSGTSNKHVLIIDTFRYYGVKPIQEKQNKTGGRSIVERKTRNLTDNAEPTKHLFYVLDNEIEFGINKQNEYLVCGSVKNVKQALWSYAILAQFKNMSVPKVVCLDCAPDDYYDIYYYIDKKDEQLKSFDQAKITMAFSYANLIASFAVLLIFLCVVVKR